MTERIYFPDVESCYIKEFDATIDRVTPEGVILDRTAFYPTGGGQLNDTGIMVIDGVEYRVVDVFKRGDEIIHATDPKVESFSDPQVHGVIDWDRRYGNMRMHTAQHIVSAVVYDLYDSMTVGNQLYPDRARIDFQPLKKDQIVLEDIEGRFSEIVKKKVPVKIYFRRREDLLSDPRVRVNPDRIPKLAEELRVVEILDYDICPCAGTHVRNTSELGDIKILKTKSKGSGKLRIEYVFV